MQIYSKETLIARLIEICNMGWIRNARPGNVGGIGNTLEDLLGIEENNIPLPNASEWELKCQRIGSGSLTTLFHMEPSPRGLKFVPEIFLPFYGWKHQSITGELSFRQTIHGKSVSDRGFRVVVDRKASKVLISFNSKGIDKRHKKWLKTVKTRVGLDELNPQPYWGFNDVMHKAGTKLINCFYIKAEVKKEDGQEYFQYKDILICETFDFKKFLDAMQDGIILIDFDARTHHNHGTKFRMRQDKLPLLYEKVTVVH